MPTPASDPAADWNRQKPEVKAALETLLTQLADPATSSQSIIDTYIYAKAILADAMESLAKSLYGGTSAAFHKLRADLQAEIDKKYNGIGIPEKYLKVPYGGAEYERLFALLVNYKGAVPSALLRVLKGDSVHTERRIRELRELGLKIESRREAGRDVYELSDLTLDTSLIPTIVANNVTTRGKKVLDNAEYKRLIALAQSVA